MCSFRYNKSVLRYILWYSNYDSIKTVSVVSANGVQLKKGLQSIYFETLINYVKSTGIEPNDIKNQIFTNSKKIIQKTSNP